MAGTRTTSRRIARVFGLLVLLAVFVGAGPARPAAAHAELLTSDPSGGSVFETAPAQVTLAFTEAVEISLGAVELFDGTGSAIELDDATHPGGDGTQVVVALPSLGDGSYVVSWKVLSADSHPVSGAFTFQVGDLSTLEAGVLGEVAAGASTNEQAGALLDVLRVLLIAGSAAVGGLLALQGFGVVEWNARHRRVASAGALVGGLAGWLMIPVEVAYVDGRSVSAALVDPSAWRLLLETDIGVAWAVRAIALYLGGFALIATVRYHRAGWWRSALVAELVVIAGAFAYGGHGATGRWMLFGIGTTIVHVIAMMIWIGGLVGLLLGLDQLGPVAVRRWSSIAFVAATAVIVSGTVQAVRQLPELSSLWDSDYGRLLLAKVCAVALVVVFAAAARRMVRTDGERGAMRRTIGTELLFAAAVIAITGALMGANPNTVEAGGLYAQTLVSDDYIASVTIDPARVGANQLHLYLSSPGGSLSQPDSVSVTIADPASGIAPLEVAVVAAGASHYQSTDLTVPFPSEWTLTIRAVYDTFTEVVFSAEVPIR